MFETITSIIPIDTFYLLLQEDGSEILLTLLKCII